MRILFLASLAAAMVLCSPVLNAQDCNNNGQTDDLDIAQGLSSDCDANSIPDECDIEADALADCNQNGLLDACEPVGASLLTGAQNGEVAISGDTMLISEAAPILEPGEVPDGEPLPPRSVDVYERLGTQWLLTGSLTPSDNIVDDNFGMSLAIDGNLAAVGAPGSSGQQGAVYLFERTGASWVQVDLLTAENPAIDDFYGMSVGIHGTDVIVGAPQTQEVELEIGPGGFAEMWSQTGTSWSRTGHVSVTNPLAGGGEENGGAVALGAGGWAFVGAPGANAGSGRVHMYLQVGGTWLLVGSLLASDAGQNTLFGTQIETDGNTMVVVADRSPNVNGPIGAIYTFLRTATTWSQVDKTTSPLNANNTNAYGRSISLIGEHLAVGEPNIDNQQGSVHLYRRDGLGWQLRESLRPATILDGDRYGSSAATNGTWTGVVAEGIPSSFVTHTEISEDCDGNGIDDRCDITSGTHQDCNGNGIPDNCDIADGTSPDCDEDGIPDSCNLADGAPDCNLNNVPDSCDIAQGTSTDCNGDSIADDCQTDCDENGIPDDCDLANGTPDCDGNLIPDSCDLAVGFSEDCNGNGVPDDCDLTDGLADCDGDGLLDSCEIAQGEDDCDLNGIPDSCEISDAPSLDCNSNGQLDSCDIDLALSPDCDGNQVPDECQVSAGTSEDCNTNGIPDECELPDLVDITPPQIVGTPDNMTGSADAGACSTTMTWFAPAATDNCGPPPLVVASHLPGSSFSVGTTTVSFTSEDQYGNSSATSFTITITDDELPVIHDLPASMTQTADAGTCGASVMWASPTTTDNCPGAALSSTHQPGDNFPVGTTTVTYTSDDANGLSSSGSFDITVTDDEVPAYSGAPASQDLSSDPGSCGAVATWAAHSSSDNCGVASDTSTSASGDFFGLGITTVTMTLTDIHGNSATHEFSITVTDTEAPVIHDLPASMTQTAEAGTCGATIMWAAPTTTDNCPGAALSSTHQPGDNFPVGTTTVTYTSDDANGLSSSGSFDITITDDEAPAYSGAPASQDLSSDPGSCGAVATWAAHSSSDNCGVASDSSTSASGDFFGLGITTVTMTLTDIHGNSTTHEFSITVTDTEAPVIHDLPASMTQTAEAGTCGATIMWAAPTTTDNCPGAALSSTHQPGENFPVGTTTVTYTSDDANGLSSSGSFDITITDDEAPAYSGAPASQDLSSDPGSCGAVATWAAHGSSDNCGVASDTSTSASGDFFGLGTTTVTMTLVDIHGNSTTHEFSITVTDTEAPVIHDLPASMTQTAEAGTCGATIMWAAPTTTDNCPGATLSSTHQPGENFPVGTTTVTYSSDDANGLSSSGSFDITITDDELPVFDSAPGDMALDTDPGSCETVVTWAEPLTSDNCGPNPLLSGTHMSGSSFPLGDTTVTYTVEDQHGNTAQSSFVITISDNEVPTLSGVPTSFTVTNDPDLCGATVSWAEPTAADNCGIAGTNSDVLSGSFLDVGDTTVTYATTDLNGNLTTQAFTVTVLDDQNPQFTSAPASVTQGTDRGACGAIVMWAAPTIFENCGTQSLDSSHGSGSFFEKGTTTVTMTSTDGSNNSTTHTFSVTIEDTEDPTLSGTPLDLSTTADPGSCGALVSWTPPTAADNCPGEQLDASHQPGAFFDVGSTTVSFTATDSSGLSVSTSFSVTVTDDEAPAYSGAPASQDLSSDPGSCGAVATWAAHSSSDNCAVASDTSTSASGDLFGLGTTTVTMTLVDIHGNSTTHEFSITVTDTEAPVIHDLPASMTQTAEAGTCGATIMWAAPTTTDNCPGATLSSTHQPGENFPVGTTTVTYTSDDANGLSSSGSFDITITDDELPVFDSAPGDMALDTDPGNCSAVTTWSDPTISDNCGIQGSGSSHTSGMSFPVGDTTVTMTLDDINGNSASHSFTITVTDNEAPELAAMPGSMSSTNDPDQCGASVSWSEPTSSDNCPGEGTTSSHTSGEFFDVGTTTVSYNVTDTAGNSSSYSFDVTVTDDQAPEFDSAPADISLSSLPGECGSTATWPSAVTSDNCGSADLTSSATSGDYFDVGTTTVTMSLLDLHGNTARHNFTVTVIDDEFPSFDNLPADMSMDTDPGECGAIASWTPPTASDNCALGAYVTSHLPGDFFPVGTTTVSFTQSDVNGNIVSGTLLITVTDNEGPAITTSGDITEAAPVGTCIATLTIPTPTITDNCVVIDLYNNLNGTDDASGTFDHGTTTIVWTGIDNHGNTSEVLQTVTVTVPQADCNANGSPDVCDLASGISEDCDGNDVPDECDVDCNQNGSPDACDLSGGTSVDCNGNGVPDECDLENMDSLDTNANSIPDECEPSFLRGDANEDAGVDIADAIFMLYALMLGGAQSGCVDATDANDDGAHDISDIIFVLNYQFQNGAPPPAPGPLQCGIDMTPDDGIGCDSFGGCP